MARGAGSERSNMTDGEFLKWWKRLTYTVIVIALWEALKEVLSLIHR
jgi:hypothetical protein